MAADRVDVAALEDALQKAQEAVTRQGDMVRGLKAELKDGRVVRVSHQITHIAPKSPSNVTAGSLIYLLFSLQAAVDDAIEQLKNLKIELDAKLKVSH